MIVLYLTQMALYQGQHHLLEMSLTWVRKQTCNDLKGYHEIGFENPPSIGILSNSADFRTEMHFYVIHDVIYFLMVVMLVLILTFHVR